MLKTIHRFDLYGNIRMKMKVAFAVAGVVARLGGSRFVCVCFYVPSSLNRNEKPNRSETSVREKTPFLVNM